MKLISLLVVSITLVCAAMATPAEEKPTIDVDYSHPMIEKRSPQYMSAGEKASLQAWKRRALVGYEEFLTYVKEHTDAKIGKELIKEAKNIIAYRVYSSHDAYTNKGHDYFFNFLNLFETIRANPL